jgi:hypothetical protein
MTAGDSQHLNAELLALKERLYDNDVLPFMPTCR